MDYDVVKSESVYSGKILKVFKDEITMPGGKTAVRETVEKHNASAIVPIDKDGNIIFVRQYRHAAKDMLSLIHIFLALLLVSAIESKLPKQK